MYERIIEIIVFVVSELRQNKNISDINISELYNLGYTNTEISTALSWLVDRLEFSEKFFNNVGTNEGSFRILHDAEKEMFTKEAWGELVQLNALGILTNEHIESLIERAAMLGIRLIDSQQLNYFVANTIFNPFASNVPGSRIMLMGNETIN